MEKKIDNFMAFIGLFLMDILYSSLILAILQLSGVNITNMNTTTKTILQITINISFMLILYLIYRKEINKELKNYINNFKKYFSFGLKYWLLGLILMILSNLIIQYFYPSTASNEDAVQQTLKLFPAYTIFSSCIFAPFVEEIIFRKCLKKVFKSNIIFIITSGLLFGAAHTISSITTDTNQLLYIIPYGLFGAVFAYMYTKTNNIFTSTTFHLIHNTILVAISLSSLGGI